MAEADIGLIGLGVMGSNLALNIAEKGYRIAVFNRTTASIDDFVTPRRSGLQRHGRARETTRGTRRGDQAAAPGHHHGQGRQAGRRA